MLILSASVIALRSMRVRWPTDSDWLSQGHAGLVAAVNAAAFAPVAVAPVAAPAGAEAVASAARLRKCREWISEIGFMNGLRLPVRRSFRSEGAVRSVSRR